MMGRQSRKEELAAEKRSNESGTEHEKKENRRIGLENDEGERREERKACGRSETRQEEVRRVEDGETAPFFAPYLYEDAYAGSQHDYCTSDSFFDDSIEGEFTQSHIESTVFHDSADADANYEGKEREDHTVREREKRDTATARKRSGGKKRDGPADTRRTIAAVSGTQNATLLEESSHPRGPHLHKQQQQHKQRQERQEWEQLKPRQEQEGHGQREVQESGRQEEHEQSQHSRCEEQQRPQPQQGGTQSRRPGERPERRQPRLEEKRERKAPREYTRKQKKRAKQQEQQVRIYFAGVEAAVVLALTELLQQPQFLSLRDIVVVFYEVAQQQGQDEIKVAEALFCATHRRILAIAHGARSQIAVSPASLGEEFATVSALVRLCPAALCIVCMPLPIQSYLQQLQIQKLQAQKLPIQQNLVAQPQLKQPLGQPYVPLQERSAARHRSKVIKQQSQRLPLAHSSSDDAGSSGYGSTRRKGVGVDSSSTEKRSCRLGLYTHFLVLPFFTETSRLRSIEKYSRCILPATASHMVSEGSGYPHSATTQRQDETPCSVCSLECTKDLVSSSIQGNTASDCANGSLLSAPGRCRKREATDSTLNEEAETRSTFQSLPDQLSSLLTELRGVGRVVCIFQGVRASLAVPQPRVDHEMRVQNTKEDGISCSSMNFSQQGHIGSRWCSCRCNPKSSQAVCSCGSSSVAADLDSECFSRTQRVSQAGKTETGQGSSRSNVAVNVSAGCCTSTSGALTVGVPESKRDGAGSRSENSCAEKTEVGQESSCLRAHKKLYAEERSICSPGELDETIATLLVDCGIDCVEPPDATSTADYILTAVKHMHAAQRTTVEQHVRMKKSKTFTAAEEAILAEVAHAATSTITDYAPLHQAHAPAAIQTGPRVRGPQGTTVVRAPPFHASTGAKATSETASLAPPTSVQPSSVAAVAAVATGAASGGAAEGNVVPLWKSQSTAVEEKEGKTEDVFARYNDVFSFACELWGKQLMQIPTVTDKVAAAIMRQFKRPAALLQKIRVAETDITRAGAQVPIEVEATSAAEVNGGPRNHLTGKGKGAYKPAANCGLHAGGNLLVQTELDSLLKIDRSLQDDARHDAEKRGNRIRKKMQVDIGVEGFVRELADFVLHAVSAHASYPKSAGTQEDVTDVAEDVGAWRAADKVARMGIARARKLYLLFRANAARTS